MKWIVLALVAGPFCATPAHAQARSVNVQAICMDARGLPHPAAQTFSEAEVAADYSGELFRCLPGTAMRYEANAYRHDCAAGEALWYEERRLSCRTEAALETEQERELLRRFGPGVKTVQIASEATSAPSPDGPRIVNGYARPH
jgi:hypothetical protein